MKKWLLLGMVLLALVFATQAGAVDYVLKHDSNFDGTAEFSVDTSGNIVTTGDITVSGSGIITGNLTNTAVKADGYVWFSAMDFPYYPAGAATWALTRGAQGNYYMRRTASAATFYIPINLSKLLHRTTASKGIKVTSVDYVYNITVSDLTGHTATLTKATYASDTAVTFSYFAGGTLAYSPLTTSLGLAAATNPKLSTITIGTPVYDNTADTALILEIAATAASGTVFDLYGIGVYYTWKPL